MREPIGTGVPGGIVLLNDEFFEPKLISGCLMKGVICTAVLEIIFLLANSEGGCCAGTIFGLWAKLGSLMSDGGLC